MAMNSRRVKYFAFFAILWCVIAGVSLVQQFSSLSQGGAVVVVAKGGSDTKTKGALASPPLSILTIDSDFYSDFYSPDDDSASQKKQLLVPTWLVEYGLWHTEQRTRIESGELQWEDRRILLIKCVGSGRCGGFADRIKMFDFHLLTCAQSKRMIFYYWERPTPITDFLHPGPLLNWTTPTILLQKIQSNSKHLKVVKPGGRNSPEPVEVIRDPSVWVFQGSFAAPHRSTFSKLQEEWRQTNFSTTIYSSNSDKNKNKNNHNKHTTTTTTTTITTEYPTNYHPHLMHDMFYSLFHPAPVISELVIQHMRQLNLVPNQFNAVHLRSLYPNEPYRIANTTSVLLQSCILAIECGSLLLHYHNDDSLLLSTTTTNTTTTRPTTTTTTNETSSDQRSLLNSSSFSSLYSPPIYFAADNILALSLAQNWTRTSSRNSSSSSSSSSSGVVVVSHLDAPGLLPSTKNVHLNFHNTPQQNDPTEYYSIFIDLFIMSFARCVSYGIGGFGELAQLISFNPSCSQKRPIGTNNYSCKRPTIDLY